MKKYTVAPGTWWRRFASIIDLGIALGVVVLAHYFWNGHTIADLDDTGRRALYQQMAGVSATLFGFTLTGLGLLMTAADKPLVGFPKGIPEPQRAAVARTGFALLGALAATLVVSFGLLVIDTSRCPLDFPHSLVLFFPALTAIKIVRVVGHLRVLVPPKPADKP